MKRLIILVLILLFSVPLLTQSTYNAPETGYEFGLKLIDKLSTNTGAFN